MRGMVRKFLADEQGATVIEYGLILAVLSLVIVAGVGRTANALLFLWGNNTSKLNEGLTRY